MSKVMIRLFAAAALAAAVCSTALAQDHTRNWDDGAVVAVTEVHIKPGMFNAYVNDLNNVWRRFLDEQKKDGSVVSYGMFANTSPRHGEPDLYLTVTYANWAAFDRGEEYFEAIREKVIGSAEDMRTASVKRGDLRELGSEYVLREIKFRD
jgi:hypothetical protein